MGPAPLVGRRDVRSGSQMDAMNGRLFFDKLFGPQARIEPGSSQAVVDCLQPETRYGGGGEQGEALFGQIGRLTASYQPLLPKRAQLSGVCGDGSATGAAAL